MQDSEQAETKGTEEQAIELPPEAHDRLLSYQAEDETLAETLERLLVTLPHGKNFDDAGIDPTMLDHETRFVLERWPEGGGHVGARVYRTKSRYLRANSEVINHTPGINEADSE